GSAVALVIVTLGYTYPVYRYLRRIGASLTLRVDVPSIPTRTVSEAAIRSVSDAAIRSVSDAAGGPQSNQRIDAAEDAWWRPIGRMWLGACLSGVALLGTWAAVQWAPSWADELTQGQVPEAKASTQIWSSLGAIVGTLAA